MELQVPGQGDRGQKGLAHFLPTNPYVLGLGAVCAHWEKGPTLKICTSWAPVAHICNPSYLGRVSNPGWTRPHHGRHDRSANDSYPRQGTGVRDGSAPVPLEYGR
jgi:hypothetical protein